jgi:hypothetical protein
VIKQQNFKMSSWGDIADEIDGESNVYYRVASSVSTLSSSKACCELVFDVTSDPHEISEEPISWLLKATNSISEYDHGMNAECSINLLANATSVAVLATNSEIIQVEKKRAFADKYLRYRHELFHSLVSNYLRLDKTKSDIKFSDCLPIKSDRTPDNIIVKGNQVIIIEVTVTTDYEKSLFRKGSVEHGYASKYTEEMMELESLGFEVHYKVLIYDVLKLENREYINELNTLLDILECDAGEISLNCLEQHRQELMIIHNYTIRNFSGEMSSILSSKSKIMIKDGDIDAIRDLLSLRQIENDHTYLRLTVSKDINAKLMFVLPKLSTFLQRYYKSTNIILVYNILNSKFFFEKDRKLGMSFNKWSEALNTNDYISIILNTYVRSSGVLKEVHKYDTGVDFFILQPKTSKRLPSHVNLKNRFYIHRNVSYGTWAEAESDDNDISIYKSAYYDPNYEKRIFEMVKNLDENTDWCNVPNNGFKTLAHCKINEEMQKEALADYRLALFKDNEFNFEVLPPKVYSFKNSFIYPIADPCSLKHSSYKEKPTQLILGLLSSIQDQTYTCEVLQMSLGAFEFGTKFDKRLLSPDYQTLKNERSKFCSNYYQKLKEITIDNDLKTMPKYKDALKYSPELENHHKLMTEKINEMKKYMSDKNLKEHKLPLLKLNAKKKTTLGDSYQREMSHFKKKGEAYNKGYGHANRDLRENLSDVNSLYKNLVEYLIAPSLQPIKDKFIDTHVSDDVKFLKSLKVSHLQAKSKLIDSLENCNLMHVINLISRLCHSLMYYSQCSFSSQYVAVDNLGYENVLLMVKGGKKVFKTKGSKLFRIFYPVNDKVIPFITDGITSSYKIITIREQKYCISPWIILHEANMTEGISMNHKVGGFLLMNLEKKIDEQKMSLLMFNVILALHGRRSTEELLHSVRYFIANNLGTHSNLVELMPSFSGFNRDIFQFFIRANLSENYISFCDQIKKWQNGEAPYIEHMFCKAKMQTPEDLTFLIYSTYLMTKAPITQGVEQVKNLKSIMKIHKEVKSLHKVDMNVCMDNHEDFNTYSRKLFEDDMKVDLKFCSTVGKFCADYILSKSSESKLLSEWEMLMSKGWQTLANTKGLRGDKAKGKFFGEKGYHVTLSKIVQTSKFMDCLDLISSETNEVKKRKEISKLNETFRSQLSNSPDDLSFHSVDKRQRGGSREIYVMDLVTKLHQQPIEAFMKKVCKLMPNEVISIPSNKRAHFVHTKVFEKLVTDDENKTVNFLTMDCRKWAPKSVLEKYVVFIAGMSEVLPEEFIRHFLRFFNKMLSKKFVTRRGIYEMYIKSSPNSKDAEYFTLIDDRAEMEMDYSFMMGIFNYLSSLMHAANQLYASYIINETSKIDFGISTDMTLLCHSDDSAGKLITRDDKFATRALFLYEVLLKCCNHLLSIKKSVMGKTYFEFLSILYYKNKLMPLLPKFLSGINFRPTDKGYTADIVASLNRSNELILNGATFDKCYIAIKVQSHLIWKFYFNKDPAESDYSRPIQLMGMPDPHPLSALIVGSDCELIRIYMTSGPSQLNRVHKILTTLSTNYDSEESMLPNLVVKSTVEVVKPLLKTLISLIKTNASDFSESWSISNVSYKNTYLDAIQIALKCQDRSFVSAMQDEELTRRISRSYYFRNTNCIDTVYGSMGYKGLRKVINELLLVSSFDVVDKDCIAENIGVDVSDQLLKNLSLDLDMSSKKVVEVLELMHGEYMFFLKYMDKINIEKIKTEIRRNTCKPVHLLIQKTTQPLVKIKDVASLVSFCKEPEYKGLLPDLTNLPVLKRLVERYFSNLGFDIEGISTTLFYKLLNKLNSNMSKEFYFYSNMPSECRNIVNYHDLCTFLAFNSYPDRQILGISLYFSTSLQHISPDFIASMMSEEFKMATCFISFCFNILRDEKSDFLRFADLEVNMDMIVTGSGKLTINEGIKLIKNKWCKNANAYNFISPYVEILIRFLDDTMSFDHTGMLIGDLSFLSNSYYYTYLSKQKLVGNKWLGNASIYVRAKDIQIIVDFDTVRIKKLRFYTEKGPLLNMSLDYLNYVFRQNGLRTIHDHLISNQDKTSTDYFIGIDAMGVFQVAKASQLEFTMPESLLDPTVDKSNRFLELHKCELKDEMSIKVRVEDELFGNTVLKLNFMKLDVSLLQKMLVEVFITNDKNQLIMNDFSGPLMEQFVHYVLKKMGLDLFIDSDDLLINFTNSKIYNMLHHLQCRGLLPSTEDRRPIFPGQTGGLLSLIMNAKRTGFDIGVKDELIITSNMLDMKATNPDGYLSSLYENMQLMYEKMYTNEMKTEITKDLKTIYDILVGGGNPTEKMQKLLRKWGIAGIEGGIVNYKMKKSHHFFDYFFVEGCLKETTIAFSNNLPFLLNAILNTFIAHKSESRTVLDSLGHTPTRNNFNDLRSIYNGAILNISYTLGRRVFFPYNYYPYSFMVIYKMLEVILEDDQMSEKFQEELDSNDIFRILPVERFHLLDWWKALTSLINSYWQNNKFLLSPRLNIGDPANRLIREHYLALGGSGSLSGKIMRYGGILSSNLISEITHNVVQKVDETYFHIKPRLGALSTNIFFDAGVLIAKAPLNEDVLDSDEYGDLKMELSSTDPDEDEIESLSRKILEDYPDPYESGTRFINPKKVDVSVKVLLCFGQSGARIMRNVRQAGENIILICDFMINFPFSGCHVAHYKPGKEWVFPVLCNENVVIHLICNNKVVHAMEKAFFLERIYPDVDPRVFQINLTYKLSINSLDYIDMSPSERIVFQSKIKEAAQIGDEMRRENEERVTEDNRQDGASTSGRGGDDDVSSPEEETILKLKNRGISPEMLKSIQAYLSSKKVGVKKGLKEILENLEKDVGSESSLVQTILNFSHNTIREGLKDRDAVEDVMQVPLVLRGDLERNRGKRNYALYDQIFRAEVNSISEGACDRIMAGNLVIDCDTLDEILDALDLSKRALTDKPEDYNKRIMLDFYSYFINDASVITTKMENEDEDIWRNMRRKILKMTSRRKSPRKESLTVEPGTASIKYSIVGSSI